MINIEKCKTAARIEREKICNELRAAYETHKDIEHYVIASTCIEKYAVELFMAGVKYADEMNNNPEGNMQQFTTPCYIKKNTVELQNKLKELGYTDNFPNSHDNTTILFAIPGYLKYTGPTIESTNKYNGNLINGKLPIDCETNEDLFLALAALRDDSDIFQWFTDGEGNWRFSHCHTWMMGECMANNFEVPDWLDNTKWHKATPNELIKYFSK